MCMGCYSYICNHCGKNIRGDEQVHLIHLRHGKIMGEAEGTYNCYGSVEEDEGLDNAVFDKWRDVPKTDPNCHDEVMRSIFHLKDSSMRDCRYHENAKSGVVAYHKKCYRSATKNNCVDLTPSKDDREQGMAPARKIYC